MSYARNAARIARTGIITVDTAQELRDLAIYGNLWPEAVETLGCDLAGDAGGGLWRWVPASTASDNTGTVLTPTGRTGAGRWERTVEGSTYHVAWFGAKGDGVTLDRDAVMACAKERSENGGGIILFESDKTYLLHHVFPFSHVIWDFNYCNLILDGRDYINPNTGSKYNNGNMFVTDYGPPNYDNPYVLDNGDFRYDTPNPYRAGGTAASPASTWRDEQRPLDPSIKFYPVGTRSVTLPGGPQGLVDGDFVWFFSGDHNGDGSGTPDWSNYQSHELELLKISKVSGTTIYFEESTKMNHHNLDRIAYQAGLSRYGCRYFWGLHRIAPGQVSEDVIFKNLRMHVTPADQATWTHDNQRIFDLSFAYNCTLENCSIYADMGNTRATNNYIKARNITLRDCSFYGKHGITFGVDVAAVGFYVYNCSFDFKDTTRPGKVHGGERFADVIIKDSYLRHSGTKADGATWMSSEESENVQIIGNTLANFNTALGCNQAKEFTFGSLVIRDNDLVGHWYQKPLSIRVAGKGGNISVVNNNFQMAVDAAAGVIECKSGTVTGNTFNIKYEKNNTHNEQRRTTFMASPYDFYPGTFRGNRGMGNVVNMSIRPLDYIVSTFKAHIHNRKIDFVNDGDWHRVEYAINLQDVIYDDQTLGKGLNWVVWGVIPVASTDTTRFATDLYSANDGTSIPGGVKNVTFDLSSTTPGVPFKILESSVGSTPATAVHHNDVILRVQRNANDGRDTFAGSIAIHHISMTAHGSSE
jgi:hypothetical protein